MGIDNYQISKFKMRGHSSGNIVLWVFLLSMNVLLFTVGTRMKPTTAGSTPTSSTSDTHGTNDVSDSISNTKGGKPIKMSRKLKSYKSKMRNIHNGNLKDVNGPRWTRHYLNANQKILEKETTSSPQRSLSFSSTTPFSSIQQLLIFGKELDIDHGSDLDIDVDDNIDNGHKIRDSKLSAQKPRYHYSQLAEMMTRNRARRSISDPGRVKNSLDSSDNNKSDDANQHKHFVTSHDIHHAKKKDNYRINNQHRNLKKGNKGTMAIWGNNHNNKASFTTTGIHPPWTQGVAAAASSL